jgi:glutamate carboxypeptidase
MVVEESSMSSSLLARTSALVAINSGTRNREGVLAVQRRVAADLEAMGFRVEWKSHPEGDAASGPLLVGRWNADGNAPVVTLVSHADTVYEPEHPFRALTVSPDGAVARGPGILDDKGCIVVGLEACRRFLQSERSRAVALQFLCTPSEEIGSPGWHGIFRELSEASSAIFGLEPATEDGAVIVRRKGGRWYRVEVQGQEAHAGRAHHRGVNAGHELALKIDKLERLTDYARGTTVNLGSFEGGGEKYNVVCGHAVGRFDVRYESAKVGRTLFPKIEKVLATSLLRRGKRKTQSTYRIEDDCPPLEPRKENEPWLRRYRATLKRLEKRAPVPGASGGGSDASYLARPGQVVIDGLGARGGKIHSSDEFLFVPSLETRSEALADLLRFAGEHFARRR